MTIAPLGPPPSGPPDLHRPDHTAPRGDPVPPGPAPDSYLVPRPAPAALIQSLWQTPRPATVPPHDRVLEPYGIFMLPADRADPA